MWRIELLGEPRVVGYGQTITRFESRRAAALLAFLALHPETRHPREVLVDRIWPDAPIDAGRNRLKQALASLRRQLEPPFLAQGSVIDADRHAIGLRPGSSCCDIDDFRAAIDDERLLEARQIRRGEFMPGFYDDWLEDVRSEILDLELKLESLPGNGSAPLHNKPRVSRLPTAVTTFVGREVERATVLQQLESHRWVTLTGLGGIGKTRLAVEAARNWSAGAVWFVPLADAREPSEIADRMLRVMQYERAPSMSPLAAVEAALRGEDSLFVLDNLEQMPVDETARAIEQLLTAVPKLRVIGTSRTPLKARSEARISVRPLATPASEVDPAQLAQVPCVQLFLDRARLVRADFQVTPRNAEAVAELARELDGIPLGIELCAAWAHALSASQMLEQLRHGRDLLVSRARGGDRHGSLRKTFESTYSRLSSEAQLCLQALAVCRGGWDLHLADALVPFDVLEPLSELIESALVQPIDGDDEPRYDMYESVRQFALGLDDPDSHSALRFVEAMTELADASARVMPDGARGIVDQGGWISLFQREWPNVVAASDLLASSGELTRLVKFARSTEWFWSLYRTDNELPKLLQRVQPDLLESSSEWIIASSMITLYLRSTEADASLEAAFESLFEVAQRLNLREAMAEVRLRHGRYVVLRQRAEQRRAIAVEAAALFAELGNKVGEGQALHILANCAIQSADNDASERFAFQAATLFRESGSLLDEAAVMYTHACSLYSQGRDREAISVGYEAAAVGRKLGSMRFMSRSANLIGASYRRIGDEPRARMVLLQAVAACCAIHDVRSAHIPLWNLALSLDASGNAELAVPTMALAMAIYDVYFTGGLDGEDAEIYSGFCSRSEASLGAGQYAALLEQGRRSSPAEWLSVLRRRLADDGSEAAFPLT